MKKGIQLRLDEGLRAVVDILGAGQPTGNLESIVIVFGLNVTLAKIGIRIVESGFSFVHSIHSDFTESECLHFYTISFVQERRDYLLVPSEGNI